MPTVELIYDSDCPNIDQARSAIDAALREIGATSEWKEWDRSAEETPPALRQYGSPTILIDRRDVGGLEMDAAADANSCRVYADGCGCLRGAPTAQQIVAAIAEAKQR
jgi:mercuric ion transport protein